MIRDLHAWFRGAAGLRSRALLTAALSLLLILPCHWQPRIQAGDLSSHIYNSWLARLIEDGRVEGLAVTRQTTNVLFDLMLSGLFDAFGAEAAQRISVSFAVLVFIWGAFAFVSTVSRRRPWHLMPCLAMLAYGWVFHMGFFNFYLSIGLCFWAVAAVWNGRGWRLAAAAAVFGVAYMAHALPVVWAAALVAYLWAARRVPPRYRAGLTAAALAAMWVLHFVIGANFVSRWSARQISVATGADQLWVFGSKYYLLLIGMLALWGVLFLDLLHLRGARRTVLGIPFQFCILSAALVATLPTLILLPGYQHALVYIAERMSLGVGVCVCALLGAVRPKRWERTGIACLAAVFFVFLYADERALNRFEDSLEGIVAGLPFGERVVNAVTIPGSRVDATAHTIDRVCIGRCFSYANYEPSTAQFRIRATGPNRYVVWNYDDSYALQMGTYVPKPSDLPLLQTVADQEGRIYLRPLKAGNSCGSTALNVFTRSAASPAGSKLVSGSFPAPGAE